ncbi:MAG TPA: ionic transporter y4hA [Beijerinckiaceae bacterium]|jgi:Ca2+:H+ antiporter
MASPPSGTPWNAWIAPVAGLACVAGGKLTGLGGTFTPTAAGMTYAALLVLVLFATVFASVHHAEVIARRTGEPYGTLVLTAAITVIEVALITSVMIGEEGGSPTLARDTVFAVVMIVCNGLVGLCILAGGLRFREQSFRVSGASAYLTVLIVLATLSLVLPNYTTALPGPAFAPSQLVFVSVATLALYVAFLFVQTVRHRDYFVALGDEAETGIAHVPSNRAVLGSTLLLLVALTAVVLLSKTFAAVVELGRVAVGAPPGVTGVVVGLLILLPEGVAALAAARRDRLQTALNLALGSSLATIGLTIPAVAAVTLWLSKPLVLGLEPRDAVMLALTLLVSTLTFGTGRTNVLSGFVHLVLFATFLFLAFVP